MHNTVAVSVDTAGPEVAAVDIEVDTGLPLLFCLLRG